MNTPIPVQSTATKVAEFDLAEVVTPALAQRLTSPEYAELLYQRSAWQQTWEIAQDNPALPAADRHRAYDSYREAKAAVNAYRLATAEVIVPDPFEPATAPLPKGLTSVAHPEDWGEDRFGLVWGDQVGAVCKVGPHGTSDYERVRALVTGRVEEEETSEMASLAGRWAPILRDGAYRVLGTVHHDPRFYTDGHDALRLGGFTLSQDGTRIDAVVHVRSVGEDVSWDESGAPAKYVLALQHDMAMVGAQRGFIVVNLCDQRLAVYEVTMSDTVAPGEKSPKLVGNPVTYDVAHAYATKTITRWSQERGKESRPTARRSTTMSSQALREWGQAIERGVVFLDLETTTLEPTRGHIIEIGAVDEDGEVFHRMCGVPASHLAWNGTGAQDVHQITAEDIAGAPVLLDSPALAVELREWIGDRVVIAHNAAFEKAWLSEAGIDTLDYADTMVAFAALVKDPSVTSNKMGDLVAWAGGTYRDAHRALPDAMMLAHAYQRLRPLVAAELARSGQACDAA